MAPDVLQVAVAGEQLADDGLGLAAEGALEVAVLDDRDRRVVRAAGVVALGIDVEVEIGERLGAACERADPQPARQPCRGAEEEPREERRDQPRGDDADLRVGQRVALERERRDEERDGEPDSGNRAAADNGRPADRRPQAPAA